MSRATVSLGGSAGERITIALVLLTLCVEVLSDNGCRDPQPSPISLAECREVCEDAPIAVYQRDTCQCGAVTW